MIHSNNTVVRQISQKLPFGADRELHRERNTRIFCSRPFSGSTHIDACDTTRVANMVRGWPKLLQATHVSRVISVPTSTFLSPASLVFLSGRLVQLHLQADHRKRRASITACREGGKAKVKTNTGRGTVERQRSQCSASLMRYSKRKVNVMWICEVSSGASTLHVDG